MKMAFFRRLKKELNKITMHCDFDANKYRELKNICINQRIQFESFTIDLKNISDDTILNIFKYLKFKNYLVHYLIIYFYIDDFNITEKFAAEYFKFCLENPQINLGWKACPLYKLDANMHTLLITL
jgi:hypothetical protein